jgi:NAD(P)-dependent dehydrogenase (short-subunit alcohol dehydrogenase family)
MNETILPLDFRNQHVVIFGGTSGINLGVAQAFCANGASVTVASRKQASVTAAVLSMRDMRGMAHGIVCDVRDERAVEACFVESTARFGPVHVLIQGAAGNFLAEAKTLSLNGFKAVVDIDLNGTFNVVRRAYPHLQKPGACVINISAPQSYIPIRYQVHACAAKAGVDQLTRVLALEWGPEGVRVNSISPGPIASTEGVRRLMSSNGIGEHAVAAHIPLRRMGSTGDIANLALFLASPYASFVSGAVISCDGGGALDSVKAMIEAAGAETG